MAIMREFTCQQHGYFESRFSMCPQCGNVDVTRVFTKAPAFRSRRTNNIDATLKGMAKDHKLSDISNKNGTLASSTSQFQPQQLSLPPESMAGVNMYMQKQKEMFGGDIKMGSDGSFWASGMSFQRGTARPTGQGMKTMMEYEAPKTTLTPVVQAACDANGKLIGRK